VASPPCGKRRRHLRRAAHLRSTWSRRFRRYASARCASARPLRRESAVPPSGLRLAAVGPDLARIAAGIEASHPRCQHPPSTSKMRRTARASFHPEKRGVGASCSDFALFSPHLSASTIRLGPQSAAPRSEAKAEAHAALGSGRAWPLRGRIVRHSCRSASSTRGLSRPPSRSRVLLMASTVLPPRSALREDVCGRHSPSA